MTFRPQWQRQQPTIPLNRNPRSNVSIKSPVAEVDGSESSRLARFVARIEDLIDDFTGPIKTFIPAIGRFLIIVTFLEDALRLLTQWNFQNVYLKQVRGFNFGTAPAFLSFNLAFMIAGSALVVFQRYTLYAFAMLCAVVTSQVLAYGLIFDFQFFLRNVSVVGGLLMVLSDTLVRNSKKKNIFPTLPSYTLSAKDKHKYVLLAGRVLLVFLFIGFVTGGKWTISRICMSVFGFVICAMVVVGFKARYSAMFLVLVLSICNLLLNNFWSLDSSNANRDFLRYDFFQTLSIVGGFLLLINIGPGNLSMDEKKKVF